MSDSATQLVATFESLPPNEQREVLTILLRRSDALPDTLLSDHELTAVADELFSTLDAEEADGEQTDSR